MGFTAYLVATMLVAADVGCAEATHDWREVEAVLQVAHNRSLLRGEPMLDVLTAHRQFARECPAHRVRVRHLWAGLRAVVGARSALFLPFHESAWPDRWNPAHRHSDTLSMTQASKG